MDATPNHSAADMRLIKEMDAYIKKMKRQKGKSLEAARAEARKALIRTGVLDKDGRPKERIVSWE